MALSAVYVVVIVSLFRQGIEATEEVDLEIIHHGVTEKVEIAASQDCVEGQFDCGDGTCTSIVWKCDGIDDCRDGSDEVNCAYDNYCDSSPCLNGATCRNGRQYGCTCPDGFLGNSCETECIGPNLFLCPSKRCLSDFWICDGDNDCGDLSDEVDCPTNETYCNRGHQHLCDNGLCIRATEKCNFVNDCGDNSDEVNCTFNSQRDTRSSGCPESWFRCSDDTCIPNDAKCNRVDDCPDGGDEVDCAYDHFCDDSPCENGATCTSGRFFGCKCAAGFIGDTCSRECIGPNLFLCPSKRCLASLWICDGDNDCGDRSDEVDCPTDKPYCNRGHQYLCDNGLCITAIEECNGVDDCGDNSDEVNCPVAIEHDTRITGCSGSSFRCSDGSCIPRTMKCNRFDNCPDGSDEVDCPYDHFCDDSPCHNGATCTSGRFAGCKCAVGFIGDRCTIECAGPGYHLCPTNRCILANWICDNNNDCGDRSDEADCGHKENYCISEYRHLCPNGVCINYDEVCNNIDDCGDNSDEADCENIGKVYSHRRLRDVLFPKKV